MPTIQFEDVTDGALEKHIQREDLNNKIQNRTLRLKFSYKIFNVMIWYLSYVGAVVYLNGVETVPFYLSDAVIVTLLGTTTTTVLGLFIIVASYLFPKNGD